MNNSSGCAAVAKPARAVPAEKHGTWSGYAYYRCRCDQCVGASREYSAARRKGVSPRTELFTPVPIPEHGTPARFSRGCRCEVCRAATSKARIPLGVPSTIRRYRYQVEAPSAAVAQRMARVFGGARWVYNAYVAAARDQYQTAGTHLNGFAGVKQIVTAGRHNPDTAWLAELPHHVMAASVKHASDGYQAFFASVTGRRKGAMVRPPKFKKRSSRQSATFSINSFSIRGSWQSTEPGDGAGGRLRLAKVGLVNVNWHRPLPSAPSQVTITRDPDGSWWASFVVEVPKRLTTPVKNRTAAVDLGLTTFASIVYSDGTREKTDNPRFLRTAERKLAAAQKNLSRKATGSKNRDKARVQVARIHTRVANLRQNHARQLAARLIRENQAVVVESLNIKGMARSRLAKSIHDAGWALFLRALSDGAEHHGRDIHVAPPAFPSSRVCSLCGTNSGAKPLSVREWSCDCGARLDRDYNAATNLIMLAARSAESENAYGRDVRLQLASATEATAEEVGTHRIHTTALKAAA